MEPTARAGALAGRVSDILARLEGALDEVLEFDPAQSNRVFSLGLTDYGGTLLLPRLAALLAKEAPCIDLRARHALGEVGLEMLDSGQLDLLFTVIDNPPARFHRQPVLNEEFVVLARAGHPKIGPGGLDLSTYTGLDHLLVSFSGDGRGVVDQALARLGLNRRVAMSVPHFAAVGPIVAASEMIATLAGRMARAQRDALDLAVHPVPLDVEGYTKSLLWRRRDHGEPGLTWLRQRITHLIAQL